MNSEVFPKIIFKRFLTVIIILLLANIVGIIAKFYFDHDHIFGLFPLFDFHTEMNIPTFYSSFSLFVSSVLLILIAYIHKKNGSPYYFWTGLSIIFLFLSIDEIASIHESLGALVKENLNATGLLYHSWVVPYGILLIVFILIYSKFLMGLTKEIRNLFIVSGTTFVVGALGFEMLSAWHNEINGTKNIIYAILYTCEEFLEMLGIAIFIYALLRYLVKQSKSFTVFLNQQK